MPSSHNLVHVFVRSWRFLLLVMGVGLALALGFSLVQPLRYSSTVRLLITQTSLTGIDPYTAIKSTERIAQNLSEIIYTTSFFNAVTAADAIDRNYFPQDEIRKREAWRDAIETGVSAGTGVMTVTAFHPDRTQAGELAVRVARELAALAPNYFGYSVRVQIIDDPLPSRFFAKPNFFRNGMLGLAFGFLFGSAYVMAKQQA